MNKKPNFGTRQWAETNVNFINGCAHDCKYCYSKEMAIQFKRKTPSDWNTEQVRTHDLNIKLKKYNGSIELPHSHDIHPQHLSQAIQLLGGLLAAGNQLLILSKPHLNCIQSICSVFGAYKDNIVFRFTIGTNGPAVLRFWEPYAPSLNE